MQRGVRATGQGDDRSAENGKRIRSLEDKFDWFEFACGVDSAHDLQKRRHCADFYKALRHVVRHALLRWSIRLLHDQNCPNGLSPESGRIKLADLDPCDLSDTP